MNKVKYISDSQQVFRNDLNHVLDTFNKIHFLIHDYTWSKVGNTWQKNIINNFKKNSSKNLIYFKKVINEWEYGLKQRIKLDKKLMNKFKS